MLKGPVTPVACHVDVDRDNLTETVRTQYDLLYRTTCQELDL